MSKNEMSAKLRELKELKAMADEIGQEIAAIEDEIKAEMTARNLDEMTVDVYKVRWAKVESTRFDSTSFKAAMPDLYNKFTKTSTTRRFCVA